MTRLENRLSAAEINAILSTMIEDAGFWRVLRAIARVRLTRRPTAPPADRLLNDHLRRDIGLPPLHPPPGLPQRWL